MQKKLLSGVVHGIPMDLRKNINKNNKVVQLWNSLTPLARNEWICWVISVKKQGTRKEHISRVISKLKNGKRRPCCWLGCLHR